MGGDVALDEDDALFRVDARRQEAGQGAVGIFPELGRLLPHGDGMLVGHHINAVEIVLHLGPVADGPDIVAQGELVARGLDAAEDDLFLFFGDFRHIDDLL